MKYVQICRVVFVFISLIFSLTLLIVSTRERQMCGPVPQNADCVTRAVIKQMGGFFLLILVGVFGICVPGMNRCVVKNQCQ